MKSTLWKGSARDKDKEMLAFKGNSLKKFVQISDFCTLVGQWYLEELTRQIFEEGVR